MSPFIHRCKAFWLLVLSYLIANLSMSSSTPIPMEEITAVGFGHGGSNMKAGLETEAETSRGAKMGVRFDGNPPRVYEHSISGSSDEKEFTHSGDFINSERTAVRSGPTPSDNKPRVTPKIKVVHKVEGGTWNERVLKHLENTRDKLYAAAGKNLKGLKPVEDLKAPPKPPSRARRIINGVFKPVTWVYKGIKKILTSIFTRFTKFRPHSTTEAAPGHVGTDARQVSTSKSDLNVETEVHSARGNDHFGSQHFEEDPLVRQIETHPEFFRNTYSHDPRLTQSSSLDSKSGRDHPSYSSPSDKSDRSSAHLFETPSPSPPTSPNPHVQPEPHPSFSRSTSLPTSPNPHVQPEPHPSFSRSPSEKGDGFIPFPEDFKEDSGSVESDFPHSEAYKEYLRGPTREEKVKQAEAFRVFLDSHKSGNTATKDSLESSGSAKEEIDHHADPSATINSKEKELHQETSPVETIHDPLKGETVGAHDHTGFKTDTSRDDAGFFFPDSYFEEFKAADEAAAKAKKLEAQAAKLEQLKVNSPPVTHPTENTKKFYPSVLNDQQSHHLAGSDSDGELWVPSWQQKKTTDETVKTQDSPQDKDASVKAASLESTHGLGTGAQETGTSSPGFVAETTKDSKPKIDGQVDPESLKKPEDPAVTSPKPETQSPPTDPNLIKIQKQKEFKDGLNRHLNTIPPLVKSQKQKEFENLLNEHLESLPDRQSPEQKKFEYLLNKHLDGVPDLKTSPNPSTVEKTSGSSPITSLEQSHPTGPAPTEPVKETVNPKVIEEERIKAQKQKEFADLLNQHLDSLPEKPVDPRVIEEERIKAQKQKEFADLLNQHLDSLPELNKSPLLSASKGVKDTPILTQNEVKNSVVDDTTQKTGDRTIPNELKTENPVTGKTESLDPQHTSPLPAYFYHPARSSAP